MAFKNLYGAECARILSDALDLPDFSADVERRVPDLEMKDRILLIATCLRDRLPADYVEALNRLTDPVPDIEAWALAPVARFIEEFGLDHPEASLAAIARLTSHYTGEFAIRPFLREHPEQTLAAVLEWRRSPDEHLRRLASEGIRPRLPWAAHYAPFKADPTPLIDALSPLIADPAKYVRTSVANNLNDVSKDHPSLAVETARDWLERSPAPATEWIVTKGLRTLIKRGDPAALELLGAGPSEHVTIGNVRMTPRDIALGDAVVMEADVHNTSDMTQTVIVDYRLHLLKKNGQRRPTTFKLTKVTVAPGETAPVRKRHVFREVTTRVYYPGMQALSLTANGSESAAVEFELRVPNER